MRFLRMLTNALAAGALGAAYLTVLVLQLNPQIPIASDTTWRWFVTLGLLYGVHLAVASYVLMVAREFFSLEILSPGWISVRVLAWLSSALASAAAVLMWLNVEGFSAALGEVATRRMTAGAAATTAAAVVLLGIAIAHYSFGRRGSRVGAALFAIATFGSLALPLAARGPAVPRRQVTIDAALSASPGPVSEPRVIMILLDGGSLEYIWARAAEGRLPNLARLLDIGASMDLATVRPTTPGSVWASVATGMYPAKSGVRSGAVYHALGSDEAIDLLPDNCFSHALVHLGLVRQRMDTAGAWRSRPLWGILTDAGIPVGIVAWPMTYPAPRVQGFVVSDRFHELLGSMLELDERAAFPASILPAVRRAFAAAEGEPASRVSIAAAAYSGDALDSPEGVRDRHYSHTFRELRDSIPVRLLAVRYTGLDTVGHLYLGDTHQRGAGNVPDQQWRRNSHILERYYGYVDSEIGAALAALAPGDLLLVVSGYGMQRQNPLKQLAGRLLGDSNLTGTHERAPDGFLLAYGTATAPGRHQRGSIVDVAPTVLYFLGLPVGRDMDGYARTDLFSRAFTAERPIAFVPSHGG